MAEYDIGGGKKIKVPDNLDPETRLQLAEVVKDKYGIDINQTSALEQAGEFVKAIPRGVASLALDVPTGIVGLFDIGNDSNLYKGLEGLQQRLREDSVLAADPRYADKFSTKLGEGIGSFGPFLGAGIVGRALSKAPGAAKGFLSPTFTAPTALAIPTGIAAQGDRLQMAREMGEDVGGLTETTAELFGGLIGITEVLPIANILGKVHKNAPLSTKEKLVSALQSGAAEGGQEVAASILQDLTARGLYSEDLPVADSMFEEFTIGGIIGAGADLVVSSMAGKKSIRNKQLEEDNLRVNENKQRLILAKKQEQAIEQGMLEEMQDMPPITVPQIIAPEEKPTEPSIEVVSTPQEKFAVVDISNPESPAQIDIKDTEIEAIKVRDKILKDFNFNILKSKLDNDVYNLGLINSKSAYEIGQSLEDSRASDVTIQQLINSVPKDSKQEVILRGLVNSFVAQNPGKTSRSYPRLSMTKAKQLLTPKQFNEFTSAYAQSVFKNSEKNGEPSIIADKDKPDTSAKYIKEIAASKNIDLDFQSPAVQYAAEKYTGTPEFKKMKQGQKELFLAKLHSLPKFNSRTTFPDFRPRNYTAQDMADFVANTKSNKVIFDKNSLLKVGPDSIRKNKVATEQFIDDLIYSGRAEQIEGTNNYKIKDNFEFDIARKAEGFNETPEEFSARLTAEGKLPPETIAELVEKETKNQEKLLPPAEIVPKTINYAETLQEGKVNKFTKELRKRLNAVGLKETGIVVSNDILSTSTLQRVEGKIKFDPRVTRATETAEAVEGEYDRNTDTIFLSLNAINPDGGATEVEIEERLRKVLDHEMIHAFRAKDLISEKEYQYLKKLVKDKKFPNDPEKRTFYKEAVDRTRNELANRNLSDAFKEDYIVEEAIAELFRNKDLLVNTPPKVDGIFNKIIQFFKTMGQAMRSSGYKSATEIFNNIESGRVGARERGVVRTTRLLDAGRIPASFINIDPDIPAEQQEIIPGDEIRQTLKPTGIRPVSIPKPEPIPPTPPAGPTTPPATPSTTPTTIYNTKKLTDKEYIAERKKILTGLQDAKVLDKAIFDKDGNVTKTIKGNYDSIKMMKWLIDNTPSQDYKIIAQKVHKSLLELKKQGRTFPLILEVGKKQSRRGQAAVRPSDTNPMQPYNFQTFTMLVNDGSTRTVNASSNVSDWRRANGVHFEALLHEGIHQATLAQIYAAQHNLTTREGPKTFTESASGKKVKAAHKELAIQANRVKDYYQKRMKFYENLAAKIERGETAEIQKKTIEEYKSIYNNAPTIEKDLADIYIAKDSQGFIYARDNNSFDGVSVQKRMFNDYRIKYQLFSNEAQYNEDVSELLTFGLTNRDFQEMLEYIPLGKDATGSVWNKFVETIRKLLAIPAKLNTELSAFLKNASDLLDLKITGLIAPTPVGETATPIEREIPTFSRPTKKYPTTQQQINTAPREILEESLNYHNQLLFEKQREQTVDGPILKDFEERSLNRVISNTLAIINKTEQRLKELDNGIQPPLFSRSRRDSKRKWDEQYYYVAKKEDANRILKEGFAVDDSQFFYNPDTEIETPGLVVFTNPVDAIAYHRSVDWREELSDLVLIAVKKGTDRDIGGLNWQPNPNAFGLGSLRPGFGRETKGLLSDDVTQSVYLDVDNNLNYFKNVNNILGSATLEELTQTKINPYFGRAIDRTGEVPQRFFSPEMTDIGDPLPPEQVKSVMEGKGLPMEPIGNETRGLASSKEELTNIVTKYMNDIANILNPPPNTQKNIQLKQAVEEAEETVKQTPRGSIPYYNLNASDTALKAAIDFNKDLSAEKPDDIPKFSRPTLDNIDPKISEAAERLGGEHRPDMSWGARTIEAVQDPITSIGSAFKNFRQSLVDKLDKVDKALVKAIQENEDVRIANNTADTATMAALRLADRARGLFAGMLTRGYVTDVIDGQPALANVRDLELENGETGGLIQILAPLFSNSDVNLEQVFKLYATLKRAKTFNETGREIDTPVKPEDFVLIEQIEQQHPEVVEVYNNYQEWNNRLIKFAEKKGLLDPEQAEIWREHSSYYPFYKDMIDDTGLQGPNVAGGSLPNNPLNIKITGSEKPIDADPIEAIARNSLSILTGALKNDGVVKLVRDLEKVGEAKELKSPQEIKANTLNRIFVFEDGNKKFYKLKDPELFHAIQAIGGTNVGPIAQALAIPAGFLRDTVTRDPGFVVVNILRDTLSSSITSGASYTPFIDSVKNMFGDMENLEKFGVLGGYDFANDEGSVKQFITRTMRQKGLTPSNGMSASGAFFKLWDGLGALTTKSDGATRMAVYDAVYKKLKNEGYNEAQAQSEAAYQALEIINFGRRGLDPTFRIVTAAIPFLNARIQGLDVLYRGLFTGQYSAVEKLGANETLKDVQSRILKRALFRAGILSSITLAYYLMVHDTDEYKNLKREVRDDNWVVPIGNGNAVKIPIPFEVGMLFKAIPERVFDMTLGDEAFTRKSVDEALTSIKRQLGTSANIPFFQPGAGFQILKPIAEVRANRNSFTNTEIVPYYQQKKEAGLQARATTNEFARIMGEFLNVSPAKIEHIMRGYTGTLGGYLLALVDTVTRGATGSPLLPSNFELGKLPVINRLFLDLDKTGGYQQQFYELRNEVDKAVATINSLQKQERFDELSAYRSNMQGLLNIKGQVRSIERYLDNWRKRRDRLMRDENISVTVKSDMLRELELERDMRLAMVPELRKKANIPIFSLNL